MFKTSRAVYVVVVAGFFWWLGHRRQIKRGNRRLMRGLCPDCRYPIGQSPVCTECVKGRPKPARGGRLKTGHLKEAPILALEAGVSPPPTMGDGESSQGGGRSCDSSVGGARVVVPTDRPGAGGSPGDGGAIRPGKGRGGARTGQSAHRVRGLWRGRGGGLVGICWGVKTGHKRPPGSRAGNGHPKWLRGAP